MKEKIITVTPEAPEVVQAALDRERLRIARKTARLAKTPRAGKTHGLGSTVNANYPLPK